MRWARVNVTIACLLYLLAPKRRDHQIRQKINQRYDFVALRVPQAGTMKMQQREGARTNVTIA